MNPGHPKDPPAEQAALPAGHPPATAEEILRRMDGKIEQVEPDVRKLDTIEAELWRNSQM
jgi:hypothetical protein